LSVRNCWRSAIHGPLNLPADAGASEENPMGSSLLRPTDHGMWHTDAPANSWHFRYLGSGAATFPRPRGDGPAAIVRGARGRRVSQPARGWSWLTSITVPTVKGFPPARGWSDQHQRVGKGRPVPMFPISIRSGTAMQSRATPGCWYGTGFAGARVREQAIERAIEPILGATTRQTGRLSQAPFGSVAISSEKF
jgi:hypothetical protein